MRAATLLAGTSAWLTYRSYRRRSKQRRRVVPGSKRREQYTVWGSQRARFDRSVSVASAQQELPSESDELSQTTARLLLLCTTALWGTYPICVKLLGTLPGAPQDPVVITALRFAAMALASAPVVAGAMESLVEIGGGSRLAAFAWAAGELAVWGTMGTLLNTWGLESIGAVRGALLLSSINVLTPALSSFFGKTASEREVTPRAWLACLVALLGTLYATVGGGGAAGVPEDGVASVSAVTAGGMASLGLKPGDFTVLCAACCYSAVKVRLGSLVKDLPAEALVSGRLIAQALLAFLVLAVDEYGTAGPLGALANFETMFLGIGPSAWALLLFSALAPGIGASVLQAKGQRVIPAAEAQPIYALVPLFAAAYAYAVLGEPIEQREVIGGFFVAAAAALSTFGPDLGKVGLRGS